MRGLRLLGQPWPRAGGDIEPVACNLCGADDGEVLFTSRDLHLGGAQEFPMVRCRRCGLIYLNPRPRVEGVADFYPDRYEVFREDRPAIAVQVGRFPIWWRARRLSRLAPAGGRILEIGFGRGELLAALRGRGFQVEGVDLSPQAVRIASRTGVRVVQGTILTAEFPKETYDLIVMVHVLEHVPDPLASLRRVRVLLGSRGRVYVEVPNAASIESRLFGRYWGGWDVPRHAYAFSPTTLPALMERAGLRLERIGFTASPTTSAWGIVNVLRHAIWPHVSLGGHRLDLVRIGAKLLLWPWCLCGKTARQAGIFTVICRKG